MGGLVIVPVQVLGRYVLVRVVVVVCVGTSAMVHGQHKE